MANSTLGAQCVPVTLTPKPLLRAYLAVEVSEFLIKHDIPPSRFGREAVNDPSFATDLFHGRIVRQATADKVRAFIASLEEV